MRGVEIMSDTINQNLANQSLAFIFPGQGSQSLGMLADYVEQYPSILEVFSEASSALSYDLWGLVQDGPEEKLNQTDVTQPALLTASVALWQLYRQKGLSLPSLMAGHSLGEYSALVCAGVISLTDAVKVVESRGRFMQQAVPAGTGSMAAILGLEDEAVRKACEQASNGEVVSAVNYNAPGQVVIAGAKSAVERAIDACKEAGARKAMPLAVSVPSHCSLMQPAADQLKALLQELTFKSPVIPVINNVDVSIESDESAIKQALIRQLTSPVRWVESVQLLEVKGIDTALECGPGKVLAGLGKRISKNIAVKPLNTVANFNALCEELVSAG